MAEFAQPEKLVIKWISETFPEFAGVGVEMPRPAVYPFARVTQYFNSIDEGHASIIRSTVQVDVIDVNRSRAAELAAKLTTKVTTSMGGYDCEYGFVTSGKVQYGPIWRDDFSPAEPGSYVIDFAILLRQFPS